MASGAVLIVCPAGWRRCLDGVWAGYDRCKAKDSLKFSEKHDNVHIEEKIIYVDPEKERVLSIPELNINNRGYDKSTGKYDNTYNWFVHWYVKNGNSKGKGTIKHQQRIVNFNKVGDRGGQLGVCNTNITNNNLKTYVTQDYFVSVENGGLIWSDRLKEVQVVSPKQNGELPLNGSNDNYPDPAGLYQYGLGIDASTIAYTNFAEGDIVYCDVSIYKDGNWESSTRTYTEPTLLKRYKYVIKKSRR